MQPLLQEFCDAHNLYLDCQSKKRATRKGRKVTWQDDYGNKHDLDYVIESGGTNDTLGDPVGFIEVAWRRYTKHSRNKAQEIQGAILPLAEKYRWHNPFLGVVLAGEFTAGSIEQLTSLGFHTLYFPYATLVNAFAQAGFSIRFDEDTPDAAVQHQVDRLIAATDPQIEQVSQHLIHANQEQIDIFFKTLQTRFRRTVEKVVIIPLYGRVNEFGSIDGAMAFLDQHPIYEGSGTFRKYEVSVTFSNQEKIQGEFLTKQRVKEFLRFVLSQ